MADAHGGVVHLFERECSVQRRHQKIVEETPSPALTPRLRERMGEAAVAAARAAGYVNAGTIEFLLEGTGEDARFYFLEMNTRLQVEHPITEAVTGIDLVRAQIEIAGGRPLSWRQDELDQRGHALECRVYAEDPALGFLPQAGRVIACDVPAGPGVRVDAGVETGDEIGVHYDPLIAKLVAHAATRPAAIARAAAAVRRFAVLGVKTNVPLLARILDHPRFLDGEVDTGFIDAERDVLLRAPSDAHRRAALAAAGWAFVHAGRVSSAALTGTADRGAADPWDALGGRAW
jgi:acetyl/propionyl-CoA carboxylase alpha subunit